ncbi:hypothetical protein ACOSQ3_029729 [Xanthoceras sorbifolium]
MEHRSAPPAIAMALALSCDGSAPLRRWTSLFPVTEPLHRGDFFCHHHTAPVLSSFSIATVVSSSSSSSHTTYDSRSIAQMELLYLRDGEPSLLQMEKLHL